MKGLGEKSRLQLSKLTGELLGRASGILSHLGIHDMQKALGLSVVFDGFHAHVPKGRISVALPLKTTFRHLVAIFLWLLAESSSGFALEPVKRVLILNEVNTTHPGTQLIEEGLRAAFENSPYKIEFYREYLDTIYFPDEADQQQFRAFYIHKYQSRRPDVIITVGPSPLKFMSEMHRAAFPGVPIVFCLPHWVPESLVLDHDFTGVENDLAALETVQAALHLQRGTKHVVVVGGTAFIDTKFEEATKKQLSLSNDNLDISYLTNLTMPDLLERLKRLPAQTIVLLTSFSRDPAGTKFISGAEAGPMIVAAANAPVFSLFDTSINHGEVGGKLSYLREQGKIAGDMVLRILEGEKPQDIPRSKAGTTYIFDSRALKRWGFRESDLPPGSIVLNRQPTFWELYTRYVVSGISLILAQMALILGLLWQRRRRTKAERELRESDARFRTVADKVQESEERLRLAAQAGRMFAYSWDASTDAIERSGEAAEILGMDVTQGATGASVAAMVHPEDKEKLETALANLNVDEPNLQVSYRIIRPDGVVVWLQRNSKAYFNEHDELERLVGMIVDVTERKLAEEALSTVSRRLIQAQEQERARIARELHDDINQRLAMLQVDLNRLGADLPESRADLRERMEELRNRALDTSNEIQAISHRLHSSKLEYLGLVTACRSFCKEVAERQKIRIEFKADDVPFIVPQDVSLALFRVLQESLQNAIKYSCAEHFEVGLYGTSSEVQLTVRDDGIGFNVSAALTSQGLGLISMRERVSLVGGTILITSDPLHGTEVKVRVPVVVATDTTKVTPNAA